MSWTEIRVRKPGAQKDPRRRWAPDHRWECEIEGLTHPRWMIARGFVHMDDLRALHTAGCTTWVAVRVHEDYAEWLTSADKAMRTGARIPQLPRSRLDRGVPMRVPGQAASLSSGVHGGKGGFVRVTKAPR